MPSPINAARDAAKGLIEFINESPSPYHTVDSAKKRLNIAGFQQLNEQAEWKLEKGGKYYLTRNESALIAFIIGEKYETGNGFSLVGAHTDSPCLKLKPVSKKEKYGYLNVGVQCYGGGIWRTWLDRDLTVAGRVLVRNEKGDLEHRLVNVGKPILRVPNLCIHLSTPEDDILNKEKHLEPILATKAFEEKLNEEAKCDVIENELDMADEASKHHSILVKLICENAKCKPKDLLNMELSLSDTQKAQLGGAYDEFIFAPRLDNQFGSYCSVVGIIKSAAEGAKDESKIRMINIFDNEECGSGSAQGARSKWSELVMQRICKGFGGEFERCIANSFLLSADQGHAIHPNYPEKHEENHQTALHKGPLLKINCNQRYSSTAITSSIIQEVGRQCGVPLQDFVVRNDSHCGTTIGPIQACGLGIRTVDIGGPELSMHSIRETCDITSVYQMINLFKYFFRLFPEIDAKMKARSTPEDEKLQVDEMKMKSASSLSEVENIESKDWIRK